METDKLKEAWDKLIDDIAKGLKIYDLLDWLSEKLEKRWYLIKLTKEQQLFFDIFDNYLQNKQSKLYHSDRRAWGKTTILNELGFTYQALGYEVLLITQFSNANEHFATKYIPLAFSSRHLRGYPVGKTIAIIDEYDLLPKSIIYSVENELLDTLKQLQIPYVGFANMVSAKIWIKPPFGANMSVEISTFMKGKKWR